MDPVLDLKKSPGFSLKWLTFLLLYALLLILGGLMAHKGLSLWAVFSSVISGIFLVGGCYLIWYEKKQALMFNFVFLIGLSAFFTYRYFLIKKFYPPGFLLGMSLLLVFKIGRTLKQKIVS